MASPIHIASSRQAASLTPAEKDSLSATPGGSNLFGTTPGGTRIMYSRDQLLSLASSPLSHTATFGKQSSIPAEISRSPDKSSFSSFGKSPSASGKGSLSGMTMANRTAAGSSGLPSSPIGSNSGAFGFEKTKVGRDRSGSRGEIGNAFNFNGPVSPNKLSGIGAQLKGQGQKDGGEGDGQMQVDSNSNSTARKEEQFDMEL